MSFFKDFHSEVRILVAVFIVAVVVSIGAILILKSLSTSTQVHPKSQQVSVSTQLIEESKWIGTYEYGEFAPSDFGSNQTWAYQLTISSGGDQLKASLGIDGFQTFVRIVASAVERDGKLDIIFEDYGPGHTSYTFPRHEKGEVLLSLEKITEEKYKILWGKLTSYLLDPGDAQFLKKYGYTVDWQTYRNEEFRFEIKYPMDWEFYEPSNVRRVNMLERVVLTKLATEPDQLITISIDTATKAQDISYAIEEAAVEISITLGGIEWRIFLHANENPGSYKDIRSTLVLLNSQNNEQHTIIRIAPNKSFEVNSEFLQILSTFRFIDSAQDPFKKSDDFGFIGTLELTGYLDLQRWECEFESYDDCKDDPAVDYGFFIIQNTANEAIYEYLKEHRGNSFIGDKSIGLGCYEEENERIISGNFGSDGSVENIIEDGDLQTLLSSSETNLVTIQVTKPIPGLGRGVSDCYSHFRNFQIIPD